jgi:hypothetical protein
MGGVGQGKGIADRLSLLLMTDYLRPLTDYGSPLTSHPPKRLLELHVQPVAAGAEALHLVVELFLGDAAGGAGGGARRRFKGGG